MPDAQQLLATVPYQQRERFNRRLATLLEYRQAERQAVRDCEQAETDKDFAIADYIHRTWLCIVKQAAAELALVYFED
jgi:hypothetical protein